MTEHGGGSRRLVVSLHDVAPGQQAEIEAQITALRGLGVDRFALKVVPNWHGSNPIAKSAGFVAFLADLSTTGSMLVLHGYRHRRRMPLRGSPIRMARARLFAPDDAEFMGPDLPQTIGLVSRGLEEFRGAGLRVPDTFCAPGWLMSDEAEEGVAEAGIRRIVGMFSILDLPRNRLIWLPSTGYMGTGGRHEMGVRVMNNLQRPLVNSARCMKVYLHPDPEGRQAWMPTVRQIGRLVEDGWVPSTFDDIDVAEPAHSKPA